MSERATAITRETCAREARASTCGPDPHAAPCSYGSGARLLGLETTVRASETLDNFKLQTVNGNRNDSRIATVQPLQVSFAAVYCGNNSPKLTRKADRIIRMELCSHR
jgi:hypothetical protein